MKLLIKKILCNIMKRVPIFSNSAIITLVIANNLFAQVINDQIGNQKKSVFLNDYVCVSIFCDKTVMTKYDTININVLVQNISDSIITFYDEEPGLTYTVNENIKNESNLDIHYGSGFTGIDTYVFLKKLYPNDSFSFNVSLYYNKFLSKIFNYNSYRINLYLGHLFESTYDSLNLYYPDLTSIKTEYVEFNKIQTSTLILGMFIRSWEIRSFSINILKEY